MAVNCSVSYAYTEMLDDSHSNSQRFSSSYDLLLSVPTPSQGCKTSHFCRSRTFLVRSFGSQNARLLCAFNAHQAPLYWLLHWSYSAGPICLSLSIQKISYHVCVHIIIPLTQCLSCILLCVSMMSGDSARSHVFCCMHRHIVHCCVYQSELGAVCGPKAALHRRVGSGVQGRPWVAFPHHMAEYHTPQNEWPGH